MTDTTVTLCYRGPSPRVRVSEFGIDAGPGDEIEVAADESVVVARDDDGEPAEIQPLVDMLTERLGFERVEHYTDILSGTIADLEAELATGEYDAHLDALAHAEREEQNRKGALEAIAARRDA